MLVSAVQQSESALCVYISPLFGFPSHLGHHRALSWVPCAVNSLFSSVFYFVHSSMWIPISQFIPALPPQLSSLCLRLYFCFANRFIYHFSRFHLYVLVYDIGIFLSDLLHSVWSSLAPSMSLQTAQFCSSFWLRDTIAFLKKACLFATFLKQFDILIG